MTRQAVLAGPKVKPESVGRSIQLNEGMGSLNTSVPVVVIAPGYHGHAIARSLGRLGVKVYGVHADPRSPAARSRYWENNTFWDFTAHPASASINRMLQLSREIGRTPILLPTDDWSCLFVADHAEELKQGFLFPDQPAGLARLLSNKETMNGLCRQYSIPTPHTVFPRSRQDVLAYLKTAIFPIMLKGIDTVALLRHAGTRMTLVHDQETLLRIYDEWEVPEARNLMLQEYIPGSSEMIWMFNGYFDKNSECLFGITGRKIRQYPAYKGVTSLGICITNADVIRITKNFMKALGYRGILDIGYKYDARDGQYKLLDVNPRVGVTFRLFLDNNGTDVVRALYRDLTGQPVPKGMPREGRKWMAENFDFISSACSLRDGTLGFGEWLRSFQNVEETSWFAIDDFRPVLAMVARSFQWFSGRILNHAKTRLP